MLKKICIILLCSLAAFGAEAKKKDNEDTNDVWRKRKYVNLSWVNQTLSDPARPGSEMKSDIGASSESTAELKEAIISVKEKFIK